MERLTLHKLSHLKKFVFPIFIIGGVIALIVWFIVGAPSVPQEDIIACRGIHWHPELTIFIKNEKQDIPANIGLGDV